jgi:shikimate kinase/3-dehydroquinate synthase
MMGAGKSAVGRMLARMLKTRSVDTDDAIEKEAGVRISEIFEKEGESGFRARELSVVEKLCTDSQVVSLGGGALTQAALKALTQKHGTLVYLRARPETLLQRVGDGRSRPLLANMSREERLERIQELLEARERDYAEAAIIIYSYRKRPGAVASELLDRLREQGIVGNDMDVEGST